MLEAQTLLRQIVTPPPPAPPGLHLIVGPRAIQSIILFSLMRYLHSGRRVYWIDGGNWFDALVLAKVSRAAQLDERKVLGNILMARHFTAIQMTAMLAKQVPRIPAGTPIILSDPMALF